jgi:hypothetical protein
MRTSSCRSTRQFAQRRFNPEIYPNTLIGIIEGACREGGSLNQFRDWCATAALSQATLASAGLF